MAMNVLLMAALWLLPGGAAAGQATEPSAPRSTTERPNMSVPGLEQTLTGPLMDATCSAIADGRSELTRTPRIMPPRDTVNAPARATERQADKRSPSPSTPENAVPDKYKDCKIKSSTTSFAILANGKVYMMDRISNQTMQEHMLKSGSDSADTNSREWITRTVVGTATSDDVLTLRAVRK